MYFDHLLVIVAPLVVRSLVSSTEDFLISAETSHPVSGGASRLLFLGDGCSLSMKYGLIEASGGLRAFRTLYRILVP